MRWSEAQQRAIGWAGSEAHGPSYHYQYMEKVHTINYYSWTIFPLITILNKKNRLQSIYFYFPFILILNNKYGKYSDLFKHKNRA